MYSCFYLASAPCRTEATGSRPEKKPSIMALEGKRHWLTIGVNYRLNSVPLAVSSSAALPWLSWMLVTPTSLAVVSKREDYVRYGSVYGHELDMKEN